MLKAQKKLTKKELKRDPLLDTMVKTQTFYEDNKKRIHGIGGGFIAIAVIIFLLSFLHQSNEQEASVLLGKAQVEFQEGNFDKSRQFLEYLIDGYSGTTSGDQGLFLLANIDFREKKFSEAKEHFQKFVDTYSGSNILLSSGYAGLGACYEAEENYAAAADAFLQAWKAADDFPEAHDYLYNAAIDFEFAGNIEKATEYFNRLVEEYPDSPHVFDAKAKMAMLAAN